MYVWHLWGNVWQIGDGEDFANHIIAVLVVKVILMGLLLAVTAAFIGFWLLYKLIQLCIVAPKFGLPVAGGLILVGIVLAVSVDWSTETTAARPTIRSTSRSVESTASAAVASSTTTATQPSPSLSTAQVVIAPTFIVNTMPVGCHKEPEAGSPIVVQRSAGSVQAMDTSIRRPDGVWHREVDRQCWTRTDPGPVRTFGTVQDADNYAGTIALTPGTWVAIVGLSANDCFNLREQPGTKGRVLKCHGNGTRMQLIEGPRIVDGKRWWRVRVGGWMVDDNFARQ
jgi:hypothetical protein